VPRISRDSCPETLWAQKAYLNTALLLPSKLNLAEFTLSNGVSENVLAKLCVFFPFRVVMATPCASPALFWFAVCHNRRGRGIIMGAADMTRLSFGKPFPFPLHVFLGLRNRYCI
jgi:hypothetical protein